MTATGGGRRTDAPVGAAAPPEIYAKAWWTRRAATRCSAPLRWKERDAELNKIASGPDFKGAKRDPGLDEGRHHGGLRAGEGWFWYIPLHSDIVSVGVVGEPSYITRHPDADAIFAREAKACVWIHRPHQGGKAGGAVRTTGEYIVPLAPDRGRRLLPRGRRLRLPGPLFSTGCSSR